MGSLFIFHRILYAISAQRFCVKFTLQQYTTGKNIMLSTKIRSTIHHDGGATDFKNAVEGNTPLIDKSLLIKTVINDYSKFNMLAFPSGFGKTINLSMLKYFFDIAEQAHSDLFKNLAISKAGECYWQHYGKYPVIFLSLNTLIHEQYEDKYKEFLADLYQKYQAVLFEKNVLDEYDSKFYQAIIDKKADAMEVKFALKRLIKLLYSAYNERVILLIDTGKIGLYRTNKIEDYFADILSSLKNDALLKKAIVSGVLPLRSSKGNNLPYFYRTILIPNQYTPFYGYSENETKQLLSICSTSNMLKELTQRHGGHFDEEKNQLINPQLTMTYLATWQRLFFALEDKPNPLPSVLNKIIADYVIDFTELSDTQLMLMILLANAETVKTSIDNLLQNKFIIREIREYEENDQDIWRLLVFCGYLLGKKVYPENKCQPRISDHFLLSIPNKTAFQFFKSVAQHWVTQTKAPALLTSDVSATPLNRRAH